MSISYLMGRNGNTINQEFLPSNTINENASTVYFDQRVVGAGIEFFDCGGANAPFYANGIPESTPVSNTGAGALIATNTSFITFTLPALSGNQNGWNIKINFNSAGAVNAATWEDLMIMQISLSNNGLYFKPAGWNSHTPYLKSFNDGANVALSGEYTFTFFQSAIPPAPPSPALPFDITQPVNLNVYLACYKNGATPNINTNLLTPDIAYEVSAATIVVP